MRRYLLHRAFSVRGASTSNEEQTLLTARTQQWRLSRMNKQQLVSSLMQMFHVNCQPFHIHTLPYITIYYTISTMYCNDLFHKSQFSLVQNYSLWVTLNNALDYRTNGLYRTLNPNPHPNRSPLAR